MNRPVTTVLIAGLVAGVVLALATGLAGCGSSGMVCNGDLCVCSLDAPCSHACSPGDSACEVQCVPGEPCSVGCADSEHCHVECSGASSCDVDCGSSPECNVTCPAAGCTVHHCTGAACQVTCGNASLPSHSGATATCP
jgi:hypothetical protein